MRRFGLILSLVLLAAAVSGCGLFSSDNPKLSAFVLKTDKELEEMSEADRRDIAQLVFGSDLDRIDPRAVDQMIANPAKMRRDLAMLMPRTFGAFVAATGQSGLSKEALLQISAREEENALRRYLEGIFAFYDPITKGRRDALRQRFGGWFDYLAPEVRQKLVWDDAEFQRAMTDDAHALQIVDAGIRYQQDTVDSEEVGEATRDDAYYLLQRIDEIQRQYGGTKLPPASGSTRISH